MNRKFWAGLALILLISLVPVGGQLHHDKKYTREHSEEFFHLLEWEPYGPATFEKALQQQKPIYLVISAPAWCYWCHVYESDDFLYHPDLYPYINQEFIPVFVDSDKRPDLTRKYLEGGWPSTTLLSPDVRRINGFTGPREPTGLRNYLESVVEFLSDKEFTQYAVDFRYEESQPIIPSEEDFQLTKRNYLGYLAANHDEEFGGFVRKFNENWREGQKFPSPLALRLLLDEYQGSGNEEILAIVARTFENQYTELDEIHDRYRLYDPIEGGFHRYSTKRDWSVPHYEKMLGDQARFLMAYSPLLEITGDQDVQIGVEGTIQYVKEKLSHPDRGFYSSQDAYLEEEYYGLDANGRAAIAPPYIDHTRIADLNARMVVALLDINRETEAARRALDFLQEEMLGSRGMYHHFDDHDREGVLTGLTIPNAWSLLAFIDGYQHFADEDYLDAAKDVANYALDNLYDWRGGGFVERNSEDVEFYAPLERIDLSKPYDENGVFAYGMLKLHVETGDLRFLEAGMKTLGYLYERSGSLDAMYYPIAAGQLAVDNNLFQHYTDNQEEIDSVVAEELSVFFIDELMEKVEKNIPFDDVPQLRDDLTDSGFVVLAILAFLAGILSFLSPCTLPILPAYFANIGDRKGKVLSNTIAFFLGLAIIFSLLGMGATLIGFALRDQRLLLTRIAGMLIIAFGLLEMSGKGFSGMHIKLKKRDTPLGSFVFGGVFGVGWSACIGPILGSLLLLSSTTGTVGKGTTLLFVYAAGLAVPLIGAAVWFDRIKSKRFWKIMKGREWKWNLLGKTLAVHSTSFIAGSLLVVLGVFIFQDYLFALNKLAVRLIYVQEIIMGAEEWLKSVLLS